MDAFRIENESSSRIVFVAGPEEGEYPDPNEYRGCYLYVLKFSDSDGPTYGCLSDSLPLVVGYQADDKVRGGGTYPVAWRRMGHDAAFLEVPEGAEKPVTDANLMSVYESVRNLFAGKGVSITDHIAP
jgi:hypothetical protein